MSNRVVGTEVSDAEYVEIQRFLHREATLLDRRDFTAWLALLTEDVAYRVFARVARDAGDAAEHYAIIDEDEGSLALRVRQLADPRLTRAENPPSFTRRFITNLEAARAAPPDDYAVTANLLVHRGRARPDEGGLYVGERRDVLRRTRGAMLIARRDVYLDQTVIRDGSVSTLL